MLATRAGGLWRAVTKGRSRPSSPLPDPQRGTAAHRPLDTHRPLGRTVLAKGRRRLRGQVQWGPSSAARGRAGGARGVPVHCKGLRHRVGGAGRPPNPPNSDVCYGRSPRDQPRPLSPRGSVLGTPTPARGGGGQRSLWLAGGGGGGHHPRAGCARRLTIPRAEQRGTLPTAAVDEGVGRLLQGYCAGRVER